MNAAAATLTQGTLSETEASLAAMETAMAGFQRTTLADLLSEQETLIKESNEVAKIDDTTARAARQAIIDARMDELAKKIPQYRDDTAEVIVALEATFQKIGIGLTQLKKPTQDDLKIKERAEAHLKRLEVDGPAARALLVRELEEAKASWNPIGKDARIQDAEQKIAAFDVQQESDLAAARTAVVEAEAEVRRLVNKRIRDADFDSQFTQFIGYAQQIMTNLLENVRNSEVRMAETQKALTNATLEKEKKANLLQELEAKIRTAEEAVMMIEAERNNATDTATRAAAETRLVAANQALADLNGSKQETQVAFNSLEAAAVKHANMLSTIQVQRDNQRAHAVKLSNDSKAKFIQAQNIVRIIQNTTQEDAASRLHSAGSELDRIGLEMSAQALIASERERLKMFTGHEADMKRFDEINSALAEGRAKVAIEDAEISARMQKNYGIDPRQASWLQLAQNMDDASAAAPATP